MIDTTVRTCSRCGRKGSQGFTKQGTWFHCTNFLACLRRVEKNTSR